MSDDIFASVRKPTRKVEPRPWPLEPILEAAKLNKKALARIVRVSPRTVNRAAAEGLTDEQADHWCIKAAGLHPACVYGIDEWWKAGITVPDELHVHGNGWRQAWLWAEEQASACQDRAA